MANKRKAPNLSTIAAAALLCIPQRDKAGRPVLDAGGCLVPLISYAEAKTLSAKAIIARFDMDHSIFHTWQGPCEPWNLTPRLRADHRAKTRKDQSTIAKVRRAQKRRAAEYPEMSVINGLLEINAALDKLPKRNKDRRKGKPMPGSKASNWKRKMNGQTVRREARA